MNPSSVASSFFKSSKGELLLVVWLKIKSLYIACLWQRKASDWMLKKEADWRILIIGQWYEGYFHPVEVWRWYTFIPLCKEWENMLPEFVRSNFKNWKSLKNDVIFSKVLGVLQGSESWSRVMLDKNPLSRWPIEMACILCFFYRDIWSIINLFLNFRALNFNVPKNSYSKVGGITVWT